MLYVFVLIHMYRWRQKVERVSKKRRWRFCRFAAGVRLFDAAASLSRKLFASFTWSQPAIKQRSNRNIQRNTPQNPCSQLNMLYIYIYITLFPGNLRFGSFPLLSHHHHHHHRYQGTQIKLQPLLIELPWHPVGNNGGLDIITGIHECYTCGLCKWFI